MDLKLSIFIHPRPTILTLLFFLSLSVASESNINTDQSALLSLKTHITLDPSGFLESWSIHSSVCNWSGVTCGKRHHRVTELDISSKNLTGSIPPELGNLSFLVYFDIRSNIFGTTLPKDLIHLQRLRFMYLDHNNFVGEVPSWFSSFPHLQNLSLWNNHFTGFNLFLFSSTNESKLEYLDVSSNPFYGEIPKSIGNLHNLKFLIMENNWFSGMIPETIGNLQNLNKLSMQYNQLIGSIPLSIFNISTLEDVAFTFNNLSGNLPNDMCHRVPMLKNLYLSANQIRGHIPTNISSCSQLQILTLSFNRITGSIPQEIESLEMLELLLLGDNNITGQIPPGIGKLRNLQVFRLEANSATGSIPLTIHNMSSLQYLSLSDNKLDGILPNNLGNLTELTGLDLWSNNFTGDVPRVFHKLTKLEQIILGMNKLSGSIPPEIFNITTLKKVQFTLNYVLSGSLPTNIGSFLPNLEQLLLGINALDGVLPASISNSSLLKVVDLSSNKFTGLIPNSLGDLKFLKSLYLHTNNFVSELPSSELSIITSLTSCRDLERITVFSNPLNGILPISVGNFSSSLRYFEISDSQIQGSIPSEIGNLSGLELLDLSKNGLTGVIPSTLDGLMNLQQFVFQDNRLNGILPNQLCKMKSLGRMSLDKNQLMGSIPKCVGNASSLRYINLNSNNLTSEVPISIWNLHDLLELDISSNSLTGSISHNIGNLKEATLIDLSMNQFSNDIPNNFGNLESVTHLSLAYDRFQGSIPDSIGRMLSLKSLNLSHNMLSGVIPKSLESLTRLEYFNVSFNELSGEIPSNGPFKNLSSQSFAFNNGLCGPSKFQVLPCKKPQHREQKKKTLMIMFIILGIGSLVVMGTMIFIISRCRRKRIPPNVSDVLDTTKPHRISYYDIIKATNGHSDENLLGKGSFGSVYKGIFEDGTILAVKVFNMLLEVAPKTFDVECEVLRNLRHRNLVKVVGSCSNQDFKAIVFEYMPNGSLESVLYSNDYFLDIMQRLNIMLEVANALEYLHYGYSETVVHCDLKPSNILLDSNMVAYISDFGITKFLSEEESMIHTQTLGTLGYMAPEYGLEGRVSTKCDVYSYGILLMEMLTRKRPSDEMFSGDLTLRSWVNNSLPNTLSQIVDESLINPEEINFNENLHCTSTMLELALRCCVDTPTERMIMKDVVVELKKIKAQFKPMGGHQTR